MPLVLASFAVLVAILAATGVFKKSEELLNEFAGIKTNIRKKLYDFENTVLGEIPGYRDHFMHQFIVFLIGTYIIDTLLSHKYHFEKREDNLENEWIVTAIFHDIAYTIAQIENWLPMIAEVLFEGSKNIVTSPQYLNVLVEPVNEYYLYLDKIGDALEEITGFSKRDFLSKSLQRLAHGDHGLLSAMSLLKNINSEKISPDKCALPIALHTMMLSNLKKNLDVLGIGTIKFSKMPRTFLLLYCDNLHEWMRNLGMGVNIEDIKNNQNALKLFVEKKKPEIFEKSNQLKQELEEGGNDNALYVHAEMIVTKNNYGMKAKQLTELFKILDSKNPVFSINLNNKVLFNSFN